MSADNKMIRDRLEARTPQIIEHIIKICLYPNNMSINHWKREIWAAIHVVQKQKKTNKFPSSKFIFESTWGIDGDMLDQFIQIVLSEYGEYETNINGVEECCIQYFRWLSEKLSAYGFVTNQDVSDELDRILKGEYGDED